MIAAWTLAAALAVGSVQEAFYVDCSLDLDGELLSWEAVRGLPGGKIDLVLAVKKHGVRELRVHAIGAKRIEPVPRHVVPMLDDVIAWAAAEVRSEDGKELVLLTRGGAWSYSLTLEGYRNNAAVLARTTLVYDMPDPNALPRWRYVLPGAGAGGKDGILLPERDAYALWVPDAQEPRYAPRARFQAGRKRRIPQGPRRPEEGGEEREVRVNLSFESDGPFVFGAERSALVSESHAYQAPALLDIDGDGRLDLLELKGDSLAVHLGASQSPTRVEPLPDYLKEKDRDLLLGLHDLDADGDMDLVARLVAEADGLKNAANRVLLLYNDGKRLFPEKPDLALRFESAELRAEVTDVDGDGKPDLVLRSFQLPSAVEAVTGLEFTLTHMIFLQGKRGFDRKPTLRKEEVFDEDAVSGAIANYELDLDCDGDGIADLAAVDLAGNVTVRRVRKESRFLRGDRWELEAAPWRRFETPGDIESLVVQDLNGDGLGDLVSAGETSLTLFLSQRRGGRR